MFDLFQQYITRQRLFAAEDKVLLAVSGGIDSMVMLKLFQVLGAKIAVAHVNFQLRGEDAVGDEHFVKTYAEQHLIPFYSIRFETEKYAEEKGISIQMAARELRYDWFKKLLREEGYDYCATAHHRDDSVETFFINLVRGTGISGLTGIAPKQGLFVRPLLFAGRDEITRFAEQHQLHFREDITNQSTKYLRNKIRLEVLPLLEEMNPSFKQTMVDNMQRLQDVEYFFEEKISALKKFLLSEEKDRISIRIEALKAVNSAPLVLYKLLEKFQFTQATTADIFSHLDGQAGKQFFSPSHCLIKDREELIIQPLHVQESPVFAIENQFPQQLQQPLSLEFSLVEKEISKNPKIATLDYDSLKFPLILRKWKPGDAFFPYGMHGKKKLSDYFTDQKFSLFDKENTWLLCSGDDIVWVLGERVDGRFAVGEGTVRVLKIRI